MVFVNGPKDLILFFVVVQSRMILVDACGKLTIDAGSELGLLGRLPDE